MEAANVLGLALERHGLLDNSRREYQINAAEYKNDCINLELPSIDDVFSVSATSCSACRLGDLITIARQTAAIIRTICLAFVPKTIQAHRKARVRVGVTLQRIAAGFTPAACAVVSNDADSLNSAVAPLHRGAAVYIPLQYHRFCPYCCAVSILSASDIQNTPLSGARHKVAGHHQQALNASAILSAAPAGVFDFVDYTEEVRSNLFSGTEASLPVSVSASLVSPPTLQMRHRAIPAALSVHLRPVYAAVQWRDIAGAAAAKRALHDMLLWPLAHAGAAAALGVALPTGILLHGRKYNLVVE